jgi:hypothetical protein
MSAKWLKRSALVVGLICTMLFVQVAAVQADGILQLRSEDPDVQWEVVIDEVPQAFASGKEINLSPGEHTIRATAAGYLPIETTFEVKDGVVKVLWLSPSPSPLIETTEEEVLRARQITTRLVVVGRPRNVTFSVDGKSSQTPASFTLGVGAHEVMAGDLAETIEVFEDRVSYYRIDSDAARVYGFSMTEEQESELVASTESQDEVFERGYRLYRDKGIRVLGLFSMRVTNELILGLLIALFLLLLYARFRFSRKGRARAMIRNRTRLDAKLAITPDGDEKGEHDRLAHRLRVADERLRRYRARLAVRLTKLGTKVEEIDGVEGKEKQAKRVGRQIAEAQAAKAMLDEAVGKATTPEQPALMDQPAPPPMEPALRPAPIVSSPDPVVVEGAQQPEEPAASERGLDDAVGSPGDVAPTDPEGT